MKATKQYLPALLLIMLLKLFLLFEFLVVTTTMKAITQNFPVVPCALQGGSYFWVFK